MRMFQVASLVFFLLVYTATPTEAAHQNESNQLSTFLEKHKDICTCVNIPFDANFMDISSMNGHGKDLVAYFEPNCLQKKKKPRYSTVKQHFNNIAYTFEVRQTDEVELQNRLTVRSIGPNLNSAKFKTNCIHKPNAAIMELELLETDNELAKSISCNNDSELTASKRIQHIEFFALPHVQGFVLDSKITTACSNIFPNSSNHQAVRDIQSARTTGCVILFSEADCLGRSTTIQPPGATKLQRHWESTVTGLSTLSLLYKSFPDWIWETKSLKSCSNFKKDKGLNVDITEFHINSNASFEPKIFQTYENVCSCKNIREDVHNLEQWSINNHDASMYAYFEQDCTSRTFAPLWIPAGHSSYSIALGAFGKIHKRTDEMHKVLSIGPDQDSCYFKNTCPKIYYTITKFKIDEQNYTEQTDEMQAPRSIFWNDGPRDVTRTFTASKTVRDWIGVDIGTSSIIMKNVQLENSFEVENQEIRNQSEENSENTSLKADISASISGPLKKFGVNLKGSVSGGLSNEQTQNSFMSHEAVVKEGLRKAYQNKSIIGNSGRFTKILENIRSESVKEDIIVPACSQLVIHAYVKTVTKSNIKYRALVKVRGHVGTRDMTAIEVQNFMDPQMEYDRDYDENTVLAYSTPGFLQAEYGITTLGSVRTDVIPECMARHQMTSSSSRTKPSQMILLSVILYSVVLLMLNF